VEDALLLLKKFRIELLAFLFFKGAFLLIYCNSKLF